MDKTQKKSGSPVLVFLAAFIVIIIVTFVINRRSNVAVKLQLPLNNGISTLSTCGNLLAAVTNDDRLYIWDWNDLSKQPREYAVESEQSALVKSDTVISMKRTAPDCVIVSGLDENKTYSKIPLSPGAEAGYLGVNNDRSGIFILLIRINNQSRDSIKYELLEVLVEAKIAKPLVSIESQHSNPRFISVSDDGQYIVFGGEKNGLGWLVCVNAEEKRLRWQKEMPEFKKISKAVFSSDGKIIYARGTDSTLLVIDVNSGKITDRLSAIKENKSTYRAQSAQTVIASRDGNLAAATVFSDVHIWDCRTGKKISSIQPGHKVISSIAFSPDSRYLATSDMRQGGTIKILKMLRTHN